jgi:predicted RNA-binding protein with PIN domain
VINQMSLVNLKLEDQRDKFIKLIELCHPQGNRANKVTVVFDGQPDVYSPARHSEVKEIFSSGETADDKIKSMVRLANIKKNIVVVTDDRDIQFAVRGEGANIMPTVEFIQKLNKTLPKAKKPSRQGSSRPVDKVTRAEEDSITKELKDVWIKRDKKSE